VSLFFFHNQKKGNAMSLSEALDKIDTCVGNAQELETQANKLYDYIPEEHHEELNAVIDDIQDLQGCIDWAKEEAKDAQRSLDEAYSILQSNI